MNENYNCDNKRKKLQITKKRGLDHPKSKLSIACMISTQTPTLWAVVQKGNKIGWCKNVLASKSIKIDQQ